MPASIEEKDGDRAPSCGEEDAFHHPLRRKGGFQLRLLREAPDWEGRDDDDCCAWLGDDGDSVGAARVEEECSEN